MLAHPADDCVALLAVGLAQARELERTARQVLSRGSTRRTAGRSWVVGGILDVFADAGAIVRTG